MATEVRKYRVDWQYEGHSAVWVYDGGFADADWETTCRAIHNAVLENETVADVHAALGVLASSHGLRLQDIESGHADALDTVLAYTLFPER